MQISQFSSHDDLGIFVVIKEILENFLWQTSVFHQVKAASKDTVTEDIFTIGKINKLLDYLISFIPK